MASIRNQAEEAIAVREATPGMPADGPYPATVEEVADELVAFIRELDTTAARGVEACVFELLIPEESDYSPRRGCGTYHPEYGFTCILPTHDGPHYDAAGGHWNENGQVSFS